MTPSLILAAVLVAAVLIGWARLALWQRGAAPDARAPGWRLAVLAAGQAATALLLYLTLVPPAVTTAAGTLVVATRGAARLPVAGHEPVVALPEADLPAAIEQAPDLATALRRYPDAERLIVRGEGLALRDRDAARGYAIDFDPGAEPRGLVRLDLPGRAAPGAAFTVGGRVAGATGGSIELLDPAGQPVASQPLSAVGDFKLTGTARAVGVVLFSLRVRDGGRGVVERAAVPLVTVEEAAPRILLLAGAPGPEPKFLRRWAIDAGLALQAQYPTGGGMAIGDGALPVNAATLNLFDLAILDDRSWAALGAGERAALIGAVRGGLGLVLRVTAPLTEATRRDWRALGFGIAGGAETAPVRLAAKDVPLTRRVLRLSGRDLLPLLRDAGGLPLASWRQEGRGRVALWPLTDSYALALGTGPGRYAELWSGAFAVLARGRPVALPRLDGVARATQRSVICGLAGDVDVLTPGGGRARLLVDRQSTCGAFWPAGAGWHQLKPAAGVVWPFYVDAVDALPGVRAAEDRRATLRLAAGEAAPHGGTRARPGSPWPWFFAWLTASGALWWFERARRGTKAPDV